MDLRQYSSTGSLLSDLQRAEVNTAYIGPMLQALEQVVQTGHTHYIMSGELSGSMYTALDNVLNSMIEEQVSVKHADILYLLVIRFLLSNDNNHNARIFWKIGQIMHYADPLLHTKFDDILSIFENSSLSSDVAIRHMGDSDICKIAMAGGFISMVREFFKEPILNEKSIMARLSLLRYFVSGSAYAEFAAPWLCDTLESEGSEMVFYVYIMYKRGYSIPKVNEIIDWECTLAENVYQMINNNELNPRVLKTDADWKLLEEIQSLQRLHTIFTQGPSI